jgi:hypothetical protein
MIAYVLFNYVVICNDENLVQYLLSNLCALKSFASLWK